MVLTQGGSVWATGWNKYGQLGSASISGSTYRSSFVQVMFSGTKAMAAGDVYSIVLKQDGSVWATGSNNHGQLGDGSTTDRKVFVQVIPSGVEAVAACGYQSLVLKRGGSVWATGWNRYGQLGSPPSLYHAPALHAQPHHHHHHHHTHTTHTGMGSWALDREQTRPLIRKPSRAA